MTAKIKQIFIIVGLVFAAVTAGLIIYGNYQKVMAREAIGASKVLTAEYEAFKKNADTALVAKNTEIAQKENERLAALKIAADAKASEAVALKELEAKKKETASLPPDALAGTINKYIGVGASSPLAGGGFSFTRPGAENTLNLFYERDAFKAHYETEQSVSQGYRLALDASLSETSAWGEKYTLKDGEYTRALAAWSADNDALSHLQRSIFGRTVKVAVISAGVGIVAGIIIYHFFIKTDSVAIDGVATTEKEP
jgi:hypothetical protein